MKLTFYGGVRSVSGANYLLQSDSQKILVDCGLLQGGHYAERQNFEPFLYNPKEISAVFITHAHLDHIGRLPKLFRDGFRGHTYSTIPTKDFAELMLLDSEHILFQEAEREHQPPLYSKSDIKALMELWRAKPLNQTFKEGNLRITFFDAGHILGSAFILIETNGKKIVFSGDLGNSPAPIIQTTQQIPSADYAVVESTYGARIHEAVDQRRDILEDVIEETIKSGGVLMIPAFALERTQELLFHFNQLIEEKRIPPVPVFIDSPLAIQLTTVYKKHEDQFNPEVSHLIRSGDDILNFPGLHLTLTKEQSKAINSVPSPKVIIAGSGMSQGGRILHHESRYLSDPKSAILFIGYQVKGSLGRQILDGAKEVKIFGEIVPVRCKIRMISAYSAHADQVQLLNWLRPARESLKTVFLVQGEPEESEVLAQKIRDELVVKAVVPDLGESFELT